MTKDKDDMTITELQFHEMLTYMKHQLLKKILKTGYLQYYDVNNLC